MSHFAKVRNNIVEQVIVAEQDFIDSLPSEEGVDWIQTSYNTFSGVHIDPATRKPSADQSKALRKNYAGVGFTYDPAVDAFIAPQPFPSWTLDTDFSYTWIEPLPQPDEPPEGEIEGAWFWDEDLYNSSGETEGWIWVNPDTDAI